MVTLTKNQWAYIKHWIVVVIIAELAMLMFNRHLFLLYALISTLFAAELLLRAIGAYPGAEEPLILDALGALTGRALAYISLGLAASGARFILILASSLIVLPHICYIISKRDI